MIAPISHPHDFYPPSKAHADELEREFTKDGKVVTALENFQQQVGALVAVHPVRSVVMAVAMGLAVGYLVKRKGR